MQRKWLTATIATGAMLILPAGAQAQAPWIDAGNQAMIMHNGNLLEQQTAPNNETSNVRKRKSSVPNASCSIAQDRERLRPEYHRRVRADGQAAANAWLRREAAALGRAAGQRARAGKGC
jgi:hypothetical protein